MGRETESFSSTLTHPRPHCQSPPLEIGMDLGGELSTLTLHAQRRPLDAVDLPESRLGDGIRAWRTSETSYLYLSNCGFGWPVRTCLGSGWWPSSNGMKIERWVRACDAAHLLLAASNRRL